MSRKPTPPAAESPAEAPAKPLPRPQGGGRWIEDLETGQLHREAPEAAPETSKE